LTGLTRDGVFKVEDGKLAYAVKNLRFTDSMLRAFSSVLELSSDREPTPFFVGNYYVPAAKLADFRFTGRTEA
jgi:predicted Zn-dependent protease